MKTPAISLCFLFFTLSALTQTPYFIDAGSGLIRYPLNNQQFEYVVFNGMFFPDDLVVDTAGNFYFTDWTKEHIRKANSDGQQIQNIIADVDNPKGIDLDPSTDMLYWVESVSDRVYRAKTDGSMKEAILTNLSGLPNDIILDPPNNRLFLANQGDGIFTADLDGNNLSYIADGFGSTAVEYDPNEDKVYYAKWNTGQVKRMNPDGTNLEVIYENTTGELSGIALDLINQKVYVSNSTTDLIFRCNLDGTGLETYYSSPIVAGIAEVYVVPEKNEVYWLENTSKRILRADLNGDNLEILIDVKPWEQVRDMAMSDLDDALFFITASTGKIYRSDLAGNNPNPIIENVAGAYALATDPYGKKLYWSDRVEDKVYRCDFDGQNNELLYSNVDCYSLDIDPITQSLYMVDFDAKAIRYGSINGGTYQSYSIPQGADPQDLAVQFQSRLLYWTDIDLHKMHYIHLETGTNTEFIGTGSGPAGIEASESTGRIYWTAYSFAQSVTAAATNLFVLPWEGQLFPSRIKVLEPFFPIGVTGDFEVTGEIFCADDLVDVLLSSYGGLAPIFYNWSDGVNTINPFRTNLPAGDYSVTITDALNQSTELEISLQPALPFLDVELELTEPVLPGAAILTLSGGQPPYEITWQGPSFMAQDVTEVSGLDDGDYTITVADANGCEVTTSFTILSESTNIQALMPTETLLYPSPTTDWLHFKTELLQAPFSQTYQIQNTSGAVVQAGQLTGPELNVQPLAAGVYFLTIQQDGQPISCRFVKQ